MKAVAAFVHKNITTPSMQSSSVSSCFGVQGHPRSLNSVPIESQYTISY